MVAMHLGILCNCLEIVSQRIVFFKKQEKSHHKKRSTFGKEKDNKRNEGDIKKINVNPDF
jgi:hypothetical protein